MGIEQGKSSSADNPKSRGQVSQELTSFLQKASLSETQALQDFLAIEHKKVTIEKGGAVGGKGALSDEIEVGERIIQMKKGEDPDYAVASGKVKELRNDILASLTAAPESIEEDLDPKSQSVIVMMDAVFRKHVAERETQEDDMDS